MDIVTYAALKKQVGQSEDGTNSNAVANTYIVPYTYNLADDFVELPEGTYAAVLQAYNEGKDIFLNMIIPDPGGNASYTYKTLAPLEHCEFFQEYTPEFVFSCNLTRHVYYAKIFSNNHISRDTYSNPNLVNLGANVLNDDYVAANFEYVPTINAVNQVVKTLRNETTEAIDTAIQDAMQNGGSGGGTGGSASDSPFYFIDVLVPQYSFTPGQGGYNKSIILPESVLHEAIEAYLAGKMVIVRNDPFEDEVLKLWYYPCESVYNEDGTGMIVFRALQHLSFFSNEYVYKTMTLDLSTGELTGTYPNLDL